MLTLAVLSACRHAMVPGPAAIVQQEQEVTERPLVVPSDSRDDVFQGLHQFALVSRFYRESAHAPVWEDHQAQADSLLTLILNIRYYGLLPQHYHFREIVDLKNRLVRSPQEAMRLHRCCIADRTAVPLSARAAARVARNRCHCRRIRRPLRRRRGSRARTPPASRSTLRTATTRIRTRNPR